MCGEKKQVRVGNLTREEPRGLSLANLGRKLGLSLLSVDAWRSTLEKNGRLIATVRQTHFPQPGQFYPSIRLTTQLKATGAIAQTFWAHLPLFNSFAAQIPVCDKFVFNGRVSDKWHSVLNLRLKIAIRAHWKTKKSDSITILQLSLIGKTPKKGVASPSVCVCRIKIFFSFFFLWEVGGGCKSGLAISTAFYQ